MVTAKASWVGLVLASGRYRVIAKLSEGGMGSVYRAHDTKLGYDVVVKVPDPSRLQNAEFAARFAREIRSLVQLVHPHIVKISDVGEYHGVPFAVMQYLPGGSLHDRQQVTTQGRLAPMPLHHLQGWLPDVADALDFIHARHHLHRDIKPDNILFDAQGHAYLGDFGVVKVLAEDRPRDRQTFLTTKGVGVGTVGYLAPETARGVPCDGRADQYGLAITVFEVLTGHLPFRGLTAVAVYEQQTTRLPPQAHELVPTIPPALSAVLCKALAIEPEHRFPDCATFARAVLVAATSSGEQPLHLRPLVVKPTVKIPANEESRGLFQRPRRVLAATLVVVGLLAVVGFMIWPEGTRKIPKTNPAEAQTPAASFNLLPIETVTLSPGKGIRLPVRVQRLNGFHGPIELKVERLPLTVGTQVTKLAAGDSSVQVPLIAERDAKDEKAEAQVVATGGGVRREVLFQVRIQKIESFHFAAIAPVQLKAGHSIRVPVALKRDGYKGPITIEAKSALKGLTFERVSLGADQESTLLELTIAPGTPEGKVPVSLLAKGGNGHQEEASFAVQIEKSLGPRLLELKAVALNAGETKPLVIQIDPEDSSGPIDRDIQLTDLPPGVKRGPVVIDPVRPTATVDLQAALTAGDGTKKARVFVKVAGWTLKGEVQITVRQPVIRGETLQFKNPHEEAVYSVALSADNKLLASGSVDGRVRLWEMKGKRPLTFKGQHQGAVHSVAFSANNKAVVSGGVDGTLHLWDVKDGFSTMKLLGHSRNVLSVQYTPDMKYVLSASADATARVWRVSARPGGRATGEKPSSWIMRHPAMVVSVASALRGDLALTACVDGRLTLWDVKNVVPVQQFPIKNAKETTCMAYFPQRERALCGSTDSTIDVWDLASGQVVSTLRGHTGAIRSVVFSPDGRQALSGSNDRTLRLWDLETGETLRIFEGHHGIVWSVALSQDGHYAVSGSQDGTVRVWTVPK